LSIEKQQPEAVGNLSGEEIAVFTPHYRSGCCFVIQI
jgi:hypothetical protein